MTVKDYIAGLPTASKAVAFAGAARSLGQKLPLANSKTFGI